MIMMRLHSSSMSSRSCVVSRTVVRNSRLIARRKLPDVIFGDHVQADGRLVEKQQRRIVKQRRGQIAAHALAERELAHRRVQVVADAQNFVEVLHARVEIALRKRRRCAAAA